MTDFNIEITQQPSYTLEVAVGASGTETPSVEVVTSGGIYLEITNRDKILPSDFPDTYPISSTVGQLPIGRVSGLYSGSGIVFSSGLDGSVTVNALAQNISITGTSGISVSQSGSSYTIYTTGTFGLTGSQIQNLLNSGVSINVTSGTGNFNSLSVVGTPVSISGHTHTSSNITDFNSSVSGLLPVKNISGSGYASVSSSGGIFTVSVTGLQPSGNYSLVGHQHTVTDITNFNSGVSGLLTPYALLNSGNFTNLFVTGVPVSLSGHTHTSSQITDFNTSVNSLVSVKNVSGSGYVNVLATTGNYIVSVSGLQPTGNYSLVGHTHTTSDITNFNNSVSGLISGVYAPLNSPSFTGTPTVPTAASGTNTSQIASTAFVRSELSNLVASAPSTLDTLNELAAALGNDPNFATTVTNSLAGKAALAGASFTGLVSGPSGDFVVLKQNGVVVSVSGHTHTSNQITDFNASVSGLIPVKNIVGSGYTIVSSNSGTFTIGVTGLQPSGNYALVGHTHTTSNITDFNSATSGLLTPYALLNSGNFSNLYVTGTPVSLSGHTHLSSSITDFSTSVSGLLPVKNILSSGNIIVSNNIGVYTISTSGLQPSGNYSTSGHSHLISDITNFNSGVSGLLPSISGGNYISIQPSGNSYIFSATGLQPSGSYSVSGHTHTSADITNFNTGVSGLLTPYALLNSGNFTSLFITGIPVSTSGHTHISSQITDLNSTVSNILVSGVNIKILDGTGTLQSLTVNRTGIIDTLRINKFYHNNLAIASGLSDNDLLIAILDPTGSPSTQMIQGSVLRSSLLNQAATLRLRQGTNSDRLLITPATGEPIWVTDTKKFYIGDGITSGGLFMSPITILGSGNIIVSTVSGVSTVSATQNGPYTTGLFTSSIKPIFGLNDNDSELSTIINGSGNIISNSQYASIHGGNSNFLIADTCSIFGGINNTIYGSEGTRNPFGCNILTGSGNLIIDSLRCNILNGQTNLVSSSKDCIIIGGKNIGVNYRIGELTFGGSAEFGRKITYVLYNTTTNATNTKLYLDNTSGVMYLSNKGLWNFNIQISAYNNTDNTVAGFNFRGLIRNNGASTSMIGGTISEKWSEGAMSGVQVYISGTPQTFGQYGTLDISVNGLSSKNIRWNAVVDISSIEGI